MTIWFSSDHHFGQDFSKFTAKDGKAARPFASVEEMNEALVERHNKLVKPGDHWYCLGDFAMAKDNVERWLPRLNGQARLIFGNHDIFDASLYLKAGFKKLCGVRKFDNVPLWFTHIPMAPWSFGKQLACVHGHVHHNKPLVYDMVNPDEQGFVTPKRYINLSVEVTNYQPVSLETLMQLATR